MVKHIMKYLKRIKNYILVYSGDELILVGYTDSNFMSDKDSRKSTSGYGLHWEVELLVGGV